jgi:hypothetical protein
MNDDQYKICLHSDKFLTSCLVIALLLWDPLLDFNTKCNFVHLSLIIGFFHFYKVFIFSSFALPDNKFLHVILVTKDINESYKTSLLLGRLVTDYRFFP